MNQPQKSSTPQVPGMKVPETPALYQTPEQAKWSREQQAMHNWVTNATKQLNKAGDGPEFKNSRLPEKIFVEYFLPFFLNDPMVLEENGGPGSEKILEQWYTISLGPLRRVDILDLTGAVIFTVPAVAAVNFVDPVRKDGDMSFRAIATIASQYTMLSPTLGENYSMDALMDRFKSLYRKDTSVSEREGQWLQIFERYKDIIPKNVMQAQIGTPTAAAIAAPDAGGFKQEETDF